MQQMAQLQDGTVNIVK